MAGTWFDQDYRSISACQVLRLSVVSFPPALRRSTPEKHKPWNDKRLQRYKRFATAGLANTLIGSAAIFGLQALTGSINTANTLGYLVGSFCGYFLHASYTFQAGLHRKGMVAYAAATLLSFAINLSVLNILAKYFNAYFAQAAAIGSFAISSYLLQSRLVFPAHQRKR